MSEDQKAAVLILSGAGWGQRRIASVLNLPRGVVRWFLECEAGR